MTLEGIPVLSLRFTYAPCYTFAMSNYLDLRAPAAGERALVLGGGGSAGNAWLIGVIAGLFEAGLDVTKAERNHRCR